MIVFAKILGGLGAAFWQLWSLDESWFYWRHPIARVLDDAMAQGIKLSAGAILTQPPPDGDLSLQGRRRFADQLRARNGVRNLTANERRKAIRDRRARVLAEGG